jgi:hypothetical protein
MAASNHLNCFYICIEMVTGNTPSKGEGGKHIPGVDILLNAGVYLVQRQNPHVLIDKINQCADFNKFTR